MNAERCRNAESHVQIIVLDHLGLERAHWLSYICRNAQVQGNLQYAGEFMLMAQSFFDSKHSLSENDWSYYRLLLLLFLSDLRWVYNFKHSKRLVGAC